MKERTEQDVIKDMIKHETESIFALLIADAKNNGVCKKHHVILTSAGNCFACVQEATGGNSQFANSE